MRCFPTPRSATNMTPSAPIGASNSDPTSQTPELDVPTTARVPGALGAPEAHVIHSLISTPTVPASPTSLKHSLAVAPISTAWGAWETAQTSLAAICAVVPVKISSSLLRSLYKRLTLAVCAPLIFNQPKTAPPVMARVSLTAKYAPPVMVKGQCHAVNESRSRFQLASIMAPKFV